MGIKTWEAETWRGREEEEKNLNDIVRWRGGRYDEVKPILNYWYEKV